LSLPSREDADHEALCRRCGVSCHVAIPLGRRAIVVPGLHCRFLARDGDMHFGCSVYADRYRVAPWCHPADAAAPLGYLAVDCPYGVYPGVGKVQLSDTDLRRAWPDLLTRMLQWGLPVFIDRAALLGEIARRSGDDFVLEPWPRDPDRLRLVRQGTRRP